MELFLVVFVTIIFPPILLFGFFVVNPREEMVILRFGKYVTTLKSQGIRWIHPVGRTLKRIPTRDTTLDIATATVVERNGNPIQISAVVLYRVEDTYKAAIDVAQQTFSALTNLGFKQTHARKLIDAVQRSCPPDDVAAFVRAALRAT